MSVFNLYISFVVLIIWWFVDPTFTRVKVIGSIEGFYTRGYNLGIIF